MTRFSANRAHAEVRADQFTVLCRLCGGAHGIRLCPFYRGKAVEARLRAVLLHKYCPNCLSPFHRLDMCSSTDRCHRCREKHHTSLHLDDCEDQRHPANAINDGESSDGALSIDVTEQTKSWAQQVEEEELEGSERTDSSPHERQKRNSGTGTPRPLDKLQPRAGDAETRSFRSPTRAQHNWRDAETRPFRSQTRQQHNWRDAKTSPFRPASRSQRKPKRHDGAETRTFRSSKRSSRLRKAAPYHKTRTNDSNINSRALQRAPPTGFRTGRLVQSAISTPIIRALIPIAPTAIVRIEARGRLHLVRAMIDPCAPNSLVDSELVRDLQLERNGSGRLQRCTVTMRGRYSSSDRITTQAVVLDHHIRLSPPSNLDPKVAAPFQFMRL
ncbi:PREDICTED: uncharacterized protein LOC108372360, partial [Rhagoletis zephyria]|uniref:uncharacterized protein LOC108372360 n=1 Tax=Rhagoletis zephyria TaxID=28612 RepID=UPI0008117315